MRTCFFIGRREPPDSLLPILDAEVERHITEHGVTDFVVGRYGRFDALAAKCVKAAKKRHPEATLLLLLPYHPYDRPTPTPTGFDGTRYPPGMETVPKRAAIIRANRYMVEHSGCRLPPAHRGKAENPLSWKGGCPRHSNRFQYPSG